MISPAAYFSSLLAGKVDALATYYVSQAPPLLAKDIPFDFLFFADYQLDMLDQTLITRPDSLKKDRELYRNFVRGALKGVAFSYLNPQKTVDIAMKQLAALGFGKGSQRNIDFSPRAWRRPSGFPLRGIRSAVQRLDGTRPRESYGRQGRDVPGGEHFRRIWTPCTQMSSWEASISSRMTVGTSSGPKARSTCPPREGSVGVGARHRRDGTEFYFGRGLIGRWSGFFPGRKFWWHSNFPDRLLSLHFKIPHAKMRFG